MSNLLKGGFQSFSPMTTETFVLDVKKMEAKMENKIIRPISEDTPEEEEEILRTPENEALLDDAMDKAKMLREDATERARQIVEDAEKEAEIIKEKAREDGYNEGLEAGNMEAMRRADEYLENIQKEQDAWRMQTESEYDEMLAQSIHDMVDVSCELIEKISGILVEDYKGVMIHMINRALANADSSRKLVISVSEENYTYVMDNKERLLGASNPNVSMEIFGDAKLNNKDCIIETDGGLINLSMDVQIKNLITAIKMLSD